MDNSSLFIGLGGLYTQTPNTSPGLKTQSNVFPAQVLDVCLDSNSSLYRSVKDIGVISFRDPALDFKKAEKDILKTAYPLDRSVARYPVPGEEVIIFKAIGDAGGTNAPRSAVSLFFYSFVVSAMHNISFNVDPFLATELKAIDPTNPFPSLKQAEQRFDKKRKDLDLSKDSSGNIKIFKQLQPYEGDFILQGRFGNTIRFGSTSPKITTPWVKEATAPGIAGDGIMILRVDRDSSNKENDMLVSEDIDKDDSSIYLCTSQRVEISLACSKELKSWKARYNLSDASKNSGGSNVGATKDVNELWQKPIPANVPIDQAYGSLEPNSQ